MILNKGSFDDGYDPMTANYFLSNYIDTASFASELSIMNIPKEVHYKMVEQKLKKTYRKKPPFQTQVSKEEPLIIIHAISKKFGYSSSESKKIVQYFTVEQTEKLITEYNNLNKDSHDVLE